MFDCGICGGGGGRGSGFVLFGALRRWFASTVLGILRLTLLMDVRMICV